MNLSTRDIIEFNAYLSQCTDSQVQGVYDHERTRGGDGSAYAALAMTEANRRGLVLDTED